MEANSERSHGKTLKWPIESGIRPRVRLDVVEQATYIGKDSILAANRFLDASEVTFEFLAESPELGVVGEGTAARPISEVGIGW